MTTTNVIERRSAATGLEPDPLLSLHISMPAGWPLLALPSPTRCGC